MEYEIEFKCFGWITAKDPRNAKRITRDVLHESNIFLIEPTFKIKHKWKEKKGEQKK